MIKIDNVLFGWGGFGHMNLDLRTQIQIFCLNDLKPLRFVFESNPTRILNIQIHGFQITPKHKNFTNFPIGFLGSLVAEGRRRSISYSLICDPYSLQTFNLIFFMLK